MDIEISEQYYIVLEHLRFGGRSSCRNPVCYNIQPSRRGGRWQETKLLILVGQEKHTDLVTFLKAKVEAKITGGGG